MPLILALFLLLCPAPASAQSGPSPQAASAQAAPGDGRALLGDDPALLLGIAPREAFDRFGPPETLFPLRGEEAWQDDVVFQYSGGFSLFWYSGRVWQVRLSTGYRGPAFGVSMGDGLDAIVSLLGQPYLSADPGYVFNLPSRGYPVRMRVSLKEGKVNDMYIYRADF
jgi:hypothetical protein